MQAEGRDELPEVLLKDLRATGESVQLLARVVALERREVTRRSDGQRRPLLSGLLSDGTATVRFTWWDPPSEGVERGTILRAANVQVREFRGKPEVTFTWKTQVGPASELELPQVDPRDVPQVSIARLGSASGTFRIEGRILRVGSRTVQVDASPKMLYEGLIGDESAIVSFSAWTDFGLRTGEAIRATGAYVREFRGRPQLVLDERSRVDRIDGETLPGVEQRLRTDLRTLAAIEKDGGGEVVETRGLTVGILPPSGIVYRCPICRRTVVKGVCRSHGVVDGVPDLRARIVLDDGTATATVNLEKSDIERLSPITLDGALRRLREQPDPSLLEVQLFEALFGQRLRVRGRAHRDDFGVTIVPESIEVQPLELVQTIQSARERWDRGAA